MKRYAGSGIEGIPAAPPIEKAFNRADQWFDEMKVVLADKLPFMSPEEVAIKSQPYHQIRMHEMLLNGYHAAAKEFNIILKKESKERKDGKYKHLMSAHYLINQKDKIKLLIDTLCYLQDFTDQSKFDSATLLRKDMGEKFLKSGDIWLAKHFFFSALQASRKMRYNKERFQAEIHCLLAFLARDSLETLEQVLDSAINHLVVARQLAKNKPWQFKPNVLSIRVKKAITLHGLRNDYAVIDGSSMTLYMIATLLEHEILIGLASQLIHPPGHHRQPTDAELKKAHKFANHALKLAYEVRQSDALLSALMRFAVVLRHSGQYDEAMIYFRQMIHQAEITGDQEAYAIALQNLAHCQIGKRESINAFESLAKGKEACELFNLEELEADALKQFGHLLLIEGHLWEAEECYLLAYGTTSVIEAKNHPSHSHIENTLAFLAIGAGQKLWSRFSCLARSDDYSNLIGLTEWKNRRAELPPAHLNPDYHHLDLIDHLYIPFVPSPEEVIQYAMRSSVTITNSESETTATVSNSEIHHHHGPGRMTQLRNQSQSASSTTWEGISSAYTTTVAEEEDDDDLDDDGLDDLDFATDRQVVEVQSRRSTLKSKQSVYEHSRSHHNRKSKFSRRFTNAVKQRDSIHGLLDEAKRKSIKFRKFVALPEAAEGHDHDHHDFLA